MTAKGTTSMSILMLMLVVGVVGLAPANGPDKKDDDVKADLMKLEGTWRLVGLEVGGKSVNPETWGRNVQRVFSGTKSTFISGLRVAEGQITINPAKTPKWIDETIGPDKQFQGIYELKGDTLRLFMEPQGGQRPTDFKTKEGTQQAIQNYERVLWTPRLLASGEVPLPDR